MKKYLVVLLTLAVMTCFGCSAQSKNHVTNPFDVECDWETVNTYIEKIDYDSWEFFESSDYLEFEQNINAVEFSNYPPEGGMSDDALRITVSYGATVSNDYEDYEKNGYKYFPKPMVQVMIFLPNNNDAYVAVYDKDGNLVSEEGNYFIDGGEEVQKLFCQIRAFSLISILGLDKAE